MELNMRKMKILQAIIYDFINHAEPVGSRTLSRRYDMGVSPATIRNEMSDLEEMGFLTHPHTSAGRVPSEKAYRLYVDDLMQRYEIPEQKKRLIRERFARTAVEFDNTVKHAANLLSELTQLTSFVFTPMSDKEAYEYLYMDGFANIFAYPEYNDIDKARTFMQMLDNEVALAELLMNRDSGIIVTIGDENSEGALRDCSLITATYTVDGRTIGKVGVVGPMRMRYDEVISIIEYVTDSLNKALIAGTPDDEDK